MDTTAHPLARLGWDEGWELALQTVRERHGHRPLVPARVVRTHRGAVDVETPIGPQRVDAGACDPTTGDWVLVDLTGGPGGCSGESGPRVSEVLPRRTVLVRAAVTGRSQEQVLAANVDTVVVTIAADSRSTPGRVERFLALAWNSGARPVVAVTKRDLLDPVAAEEVLSDVASAAPGVDVLAVSAGTGDGLATLRAALRGTVVFLGSSGAGKSTLANALLGEQRFAVGAVRSADGRGRHTTVHRELVELPGGLVLLDTPGLRSVGVADLDEGLHRTFADLEDVAVDCRFADCTHTGEPGCAVLAAIEAGVLDRRRLESYRRLEREQQWFASRTDARVRAERTRRWKALAKEHRTQRPRG